MDPLHLLHLAPDLLGRLVDTGRPWLEEYGYLAIGLGLFCETLLFAGAIVPGLGIMVAAGYLSAAGVLEPWPVLGLAAVATVLGDQASFSLGRILGHVLLKRRAAAARVRNALLAEGPTLLLWYHYGIWLRALLPCTAGSIRYPWRRFAGFDALGATLWVGTLFAVGYSAHGAASSGWNMAFMTASAAAFLAGLYVCLRVWRRATKANEVTRETD
jgi:membrane protein DedA with SNARE-associated domain